MHACIEFKNVSKDYQGTYCLNQFQLNVQQKEFFTLLGPSGCGKTTILKIIAGFESIQSGELWINGQLHSAKDFLIEPEKRQIGMVFQDFALFPHLTVWHNILFGLRKQPKTQQKNKALEMLTLFNLQSSEKKYPYMLSGGEQQRVAIARALAPSPSILLLDEPFSSLDAQLRIALREEIQQILRQQNVTVMLVTHDQAEAFAFSDRMAVIHQGQNRQTATPKEIYQQPKSAWVASFVGATNFLNIHNQRNCLLHSLPITPSNNTKRAMLRPEDLQLKQVANGKSNGIVQQVDFLGNFDYARVLLDDGQAVRIRLDQNHGFKNQQPVWVSALRYQIFEENS